MHGLGRIQATIQEVDVNNRAEKKGGAVRGTRKKKIVATAGGAVAVSASLKERLDQAHKSAENPAEAKNARSNPLRKSFPEWIGEVLAEIGTPEQEVVVSKSDTKKTSSKIDRTFGVEPLSYKNMWKVLRTVVREIGVIKEAHHHRFALGVTERVDKPTTLMQFDSLVNYLEQASDTPLKNKLSGTKKGLGEQVVSDKVTSLHTQANVVPEVALQLLTRIG